MLLELKAENFFLFAGEPTSAPASHKFPVLSQPGSQHKAIQFKLTQYKHRILSHNYKGLEKKTQNS